MGDRSIINRSIRLSLATARDDVSGSKSCAGATIAVRGCVIARVWRVYHGSCLRSTAQANIQVYKLKLVSLDLFIINRYTPTIDYKKQQARA